MFDLSESGKQIAEKLLMLLDENQIQELAECIFHCMEQPKFAIECPCFTPPKLLSHGYAEQPLTEIREGDLYFCLEQREVSVRGQKIDLTIREFNTLHLLIFNRKRVMTFETIAYYVWGDDGEVDNELGAIHNIMSRIRQKLKIAPDVPDYIISIRGVGYKFDTGSQI